MAATNPFTGLALTPEALNFCLNHSDSEVLALLLGAVKNAITGATGTTRTPVASTVTEDGEVAAGAKAVDFFFSADFEGTVLGEPRTGAVDYSFSLSVLPGGDTYAAVAYTVSAGSVLIVRIH